jgi:hypothetical protein
MVPCDDVLGGQFPVYLRRGTTPSGRPAVFAEVYWADLSRIREGVVNGFLGVFRIIFGLRHVADQAAAQPGWQARLLRALLVTAALVLRGPVAALTLFLLVTALPFWAFPGLIQDGHLAGWPFALWGLATAAAGSFLAVRTGRARRPSAVLWGCLTVVGLVAAVLAVLTWGDGPVRESVGAWVATEYPGARGGEFGWCLAALVLLNDWLFMGVSTLMLVSLIPLAAALLSPHLELRRALTTAYLAAALQVGLWPLTVAAADWIILSPLTAGLEANDRRPYYVDLTFFVSAQILLLLTVGLAAALTWVSRWSWAKANPCPPATSERRPPRLILAVAVQLLLLLYATVMSLFTVWLAYSPRFDWSILPLGLGVANGVLLGLLVLLGVGVGLFAKGLRNALHICMDLVNHFTHGDGLFGVYRNLFLGRDDVAVPDSAFHIRQQIEARFRRVLQELLQSHEPTNLAIVSHSQGTVIAADVLRQKNWKVGLGYLKSVTLVTMGSPLTHIYQHYFPRQYPSLHGPHWRHLRDNVTAWVNVFRVDDFVGTEVGEMKGAWPKNYQVGYGGHTHYWDKDNVLRIITDALPGLAR